MAVLTRAASPGLDPASRHGGHRPWLVALLCLGVACGAQHTNQESAATAAQRQLGALGSQQWSQAYAELRAEQQQLIPQPLFVQCMTELFGDASLSNVRVTATSAEQTLAVPGGMLGKAPAAAPAGVGVAMSDRGQEVTLVYDLTRAGTTASGTATFREFPRGSGPHAWVWVVLQPEPYRQGSCPSSAP